MQITFVVLIGISVLYTMRQLFAISLACEMIIRLPQMMLVMA